MTILELREARNKAWEGAKAFVESKRDKDGLLSKEDAETYNSMEEKIKNYSKEIERMEAMENMENELNKPVNTPIVTRPSKVDNEVKTGRASNEYKDAIKYKVVTILGFNFYIKPKKKKNILLLQSEYNLGGKK